MKSNFNINNFNKWDNNNHKQRKNKIILLCIVLIIAIIGGYMYEKFSNKNDILSDQEYINAKEEYQNELKQKKDNYSFYEKVIYGEKISAVIVNSNLRNSTVYKGNQTYPFESLYTYFSKYNSNSSIYELNTKSLSNISNFINNSSSDDENFTLIKNCDLIILSYNKNTENEPISEYEDVIKDIKGINKRIQIFIIIEDGDNASKINKLKEIAKNNAAIFLDISNDLKNAENEDIEIIKNNSKSNNNKYDKYGELISSQIENPATK